jgi:hypothetical protein
VPNGISAMSSIAISEGRASRIADYTNYSSHKREKGERGYRAPTVRSPKTMKAQSARLSAGIRKRKAMAAAGKMTHGGGGISWGGHGKHPKGLKGGGAIFGKPYSKIRAKRKTYKAPESGVVTKGWNEFKAPNKKAQAKSAKRTGMQSKLKKKRA